MMIFDDEYVAFSSSMIARSQNSDTIIFFDDDSSKQAEMIKSRCRAFELKNGGRNNNYDFARQQVQMITTNQD